ncbi:LytR/AlgR family response regulator transcription factor [Sphingobacterium daejeonense]|uniref:LytR/AlgR family response regulator transcription factor n=1 Tax=Sphingobacterium daejeonense TaxID=371142 RepID=UPI001E541491|nr:LytTR family DNA-binding domain-containing protein [Sphingobacterium daejeonense]
MFYSENKGTYIFTKDSDQYLLDYSLDQIEGLLHPEHFFRISRGHLINISAIKNISIHSNSRLRIELFHYPSKDVIVSRERVQDFKTWLG